MRPKRLVLLQNVQYHSSADFSDLLEDFIKIQVLASSSDVTWKGYQ